MEKIEEQIHIDRTNTYRIIVFRTIEKTKQEITIKEKEQNKSFIC